VRAAIVDHVRPHVFASNRTNAKLCASGFESGMP
jgi:hypothetical protein